MRPRELRPLVGRTIDFYLDGERTGKVKGAPKSDTLSVQLLGAYGRRSVELRAVRGVFWRGKLEPVEAFLARRAGGSA